MKSSRLLLFCACLLLLFAGFTAKLSQAADEARRDVLYTCACGDKCNCNTVSTSPGNCKCDKPMKWGHVLRSEGNEVLLCQCDEGCTCKLDPKDPSKCGCGKAVKRVNLTGKDIYFCNCGGSCGCNTVADKPGKCKCGMDLKKAE